MKFNLPFEKDTKNVDSFRTQCIEEMNLPAFVDNLNCPYCNEKLTKDCIRSITFKTNSRNMGDICVEFLCSKCGHGNYFYFREQFETSADIVAIMSGEKKIEVEPILEDDMYKMQYNNALEKLLRGRYEHNKEQ